MENKAALSLVRAEFESADPDRCRVDMIFPYTALHYIVSGSGWFNGVPLGAGMYFCCEKNCRSRYYPDPEKPWVYYWFNIDGAEHRSVLASHGIDPAAPWGEFSCLNEAAAILKLYKAYSLTHGDNPEFRQSLAWMLLSLHKSEAKRTEDDGSPHERFETIRQYIDANYFEGFSIEEVSKRFFVSRMYLRNQFTKYYHISPKQYLQKVRMENAAKYLRETDYGIGLIASSVGYGDLCCFSRAFKRYYGVSPNAFRKGEARKNPSSEKSSFGLDRIPGSML